MKRKKTLSNIKYYLIALLALIAVNAYCIYSSICSVKSETVAYLSQIITAHICVILSIYLILLSIFIIIKKINSELFFLISIITLGLCTIVLIPAWSAPDSAAHYIATYRFSNFLLGYGADKQWLLREEDGYFFSYIWNTHVNPNMHGYSAWVDNFHLFCTGKTMINIPFNCDYMTYYSPINYLPQIIGLSIGRLLGLGCEPCILLARIFILAAYTAGCYHAIKKTPVGKNVFTAVCLLPMPLMICSSFSYDAMVIIVTVNFISSLFALGKANASADANTASNRNFCGMSVQFWETIIWSFLVGATKAGGYILLIPLVILIYNKKIVKKTVIQIISIIGCCVLSLLIFDIFIQNANSYFQLGGADTASLSASWALSHPLGYLKLLGATYVKSSVSLVMGMMGEYMCWLEKTLPKALIILLGITALFMSLSDKDEIVFGKREIVACLSATFTLLILSPTMLLSSTTAQSNIIMGLQGRYFLPIMPIVFLLISKPIYKSIHKKPDAKITKNSELFASVSMYVYGLLLCISICSLLKMYICR